MLRIITEQYGNTYRLELHGTVGGEGIGVLERHWLSILDTSPSALITVGLSNVAFIDRHGEQLLQRMAERGVAVDGTGCMNRYVIEKLTAVSRVP
jgi:hypothetical protein